MFNHHGVETDETAADLTSQLDWAIPAGLTFLARGGEDCSSASPLRALLPSALFSVSAGELPGVPPAHILPWCQTHVQDFHMH